MFAFLAALLHTLFHFEFAGLDLLFLLEGQDGFDLGFYRGVLFPNTEFGHVQYRGKSVEKFCAASIRKKKDLSWQEWAERLSIYLKMMEGLVWPDLIIIGGGVSAKNEKWLKYVKCRTKVVPAKLFNGAGIIGAALAGE